MRSFFKYWLPVLLWLGIMFVGSTDLLSGEHTSRLLVPLLRWLKPDISSEALAQIHFLVRKLAHISEYAILSMLLWRAVLGGSNLRLKMAFVFGAVWLACGIFAISDEFHQLFVQSRTSASSDVLIDICGATIGLAICLMLARRHTTTAPIDLA
jgi:VanZ family protein